MKASEKMACDACQKTTQGELRDVKARYKAALAQMERLHRENNAMKGIGKVQEAKISPHFPTFHSPEATAVLCASDWHYEETVRSASVNGLNEYNTAIAQERITQFFQKGARIVNIFRKEIPIPEVLLWLGGDFISGNIHEDVIESCSLRPIHAIMEVQKLIAGGISYLLENLKQSKLTIVCSPGNHSRITGKLHQGNEHGNSLEYFMYNNLAQHFAGKAKFVIEEAYNTYVQVYDMTVRFNHGTYIKYQGGIGGLLIPAYKAVSNWDTGRKADLTVIGHWHTQRDGGSFVCNGSLIGYNPFAVSIKAPFEKPKQLLFLIDKRRGRTINTPIITDV